MPFQTPRGAQSPVRRWRGAVRADAPAGLWWHCRQAPTVDVPPRRADARLDQDQALGRRGVPHRRLVSATPPAWMGAARRRDRRARRAWIPRQGRVRHHARCPSRVGGAASIARPSHLAIQPTRPRAGCLKGAFIPIGGLTSAFPHQGSLRNGGPGFGVARQCSGNRCLARWTVWILKGAHIPIGGLTSGLPHQGSLGRGDYGVRCGPTMFRKQVSLPVDSLDPPSWPPRQRRSSELEKRPRHGPDPRFLCPTGFCYEAPRACIGRSDRRLAVRHGLPVRRRDGLLGFAAHGPGPPLDGAET